MTLIARITRLFKADLHGILDSLEEPEEIIKQAIRDMEEDLATQEGRLADLHTVLQRLEREAQETAVAMQEIEQHIDTCFAAENEPLAKNLIRQRLDIARRAKGLARAQEETRARRDEQAARIAAHTAQLTAVVQKLKLYEEARASHAWTSSTGSPLRSEHVVTDDEVEVAFLAEKRRRSGAVSGTP